MKEIYRNRIAIIGAGNIGRMLLERLRRSGMTVRMAIYDTDLQKAQTAAAQVGADVLMEAQLVECGATIWLLCPGPKAVLPFLRKFSSCLKPDHIVISFAAGVPLERLETHVPAGVHVVRVMPNMPSQIGQGMNPVCFSEKVSLEAREMVMQLLKALGETVEVSVDQMNWCVGLSGAAMRSLLPAIEGMIRAGQEAALRLALKSKAPYIGMIGSLAKTRTILAHLQTDGVSDADYERIYAPIGLDLGGNSPQEIAVGILAEIVACRQKKGIPESVVKTRRLIWTEKYLTP